MLILAPVVAPIAWDGALYLASGVAGFLHAAWNTELGTSGQLENKYQEQYVEIDLKATNFDTALKEYDTTQKQSVDEKIAEFVKNYVPPVQNVSYSNSNTGTVTTPTIPAQKGLIDTLKASSMESIEQQKLLNNNLVALNGTLASLLSAKNSEVINQNKIIAVLSENLLALNKSVATLATLPKVTAEVNLSTKRVISTSTSQGDSSAKKTAESLESLVVTLTEGVNDQKTTNEKIIENLTKKNEHLDYLKNGSDSLKNSKGDVIKPREVSALNDAEQHIDIKSLNTFDSQHFIDSLQASENTNEEDILKIEELLKKFTLFDKTKFETELNQNLFVKGGLNG
jgi:hypothetical protein